MNRTFLVKQSFLANLLARLSYVVVTLNANSALSQTVDHYDAPGIYPGRDYVSQHFADNVDPFNGNLILSSVDVFIPGPGGFDLKVIRTYNLRSIGSTTQSPFGTGWDIHFGKLYIPVGFTCGNAPAQSMSFEAPDGSTQVLHKADGTIAGLSTIDFVTTRLWKGTCSGGVLTLYSPDGTKYLFDSGNSGIWNVSQIEDKNQNTATFTYSLQYGGRYAIASISTSDSRSITFTYASQKLSKITTFSGTASAREWTYSVVTDADLSTRLTTVQPPVPATAGGTWTYDYYPTTDATVHRRRAIRTVTYPSGGQLQYDYDQQELIPTKNLPVVKSKGVTGGTSSTETWTYAYTPSTTLGVNDQTVVTLPASVGGGSITYAHYGYKTVSSNDPFYKIGLLASKTTTQGTFTQTESLGWTFDKISSELVQRANYSNASYVVSRPLMSSRSTKRGASGVSYGAAYSNFDSYGNPQTIIESGYDGSTAISRTRSLTYDNTRTTSWVIGLVLTDAIANIGSITRTYFPSGNLESQSDYGAKTELTYYTTGTNKGDISSRKTPNGDTTNYSSYKRGIPQTETRPEAVPISRVVSDHGEVTSESDGEKTWGYSYDDIGRIKEIRPPKSAANVAQNISIDWVTNQTHSTFSSSRTLTRGSSAYTEVTKFDGFGRPSSKTKNNIATNYQYDAFGRQRFASYPGLSSTGTTTNFDLAGRITSIADQDGTESRVYSTSGSSVTITNRRSKVFTYSYRRYADPDGGYLSGIATPENASVSIVRNAIGRIDSVTQGSVTRDYGYNARWQLNKITDPETGITDYGRDSNGNMISKTVGGSTINYCYDGLDRMTQIGYGVACTSGKIIRSYNKRGLLMKVQDTDTTNPSTRNYDYDDNGNLTKDEIVVGGQTFTATFDYDALDHLDTVNYPTTIPTSRSIDYAPNGLGRPTKVGTFATTVGHHDSGNLSQITYGNGVVDTYGQHATRLIPNSISSSAIDLDYTYDGNRNPISIVNNKVAGDTVNPCYDGVDRLIGMSSSCTDFTYDGMGNLTKNQATTLAYDTTNKRLKSTTAASITRIYGYDALGNITNNGVRTYAYDSASNLTCVDCAVPANKIEYGYDGQGIRLWEKKDGKTTYFLQAKNGDLLFEYSPHGKVWKQHVYLRGKRIATREGTNGTSPNLSLTASPVSPGAYASPLTLTASVSTAATGSVSFYDGTTLLGTTNVSTGNATFAVPAPLSVGMHALKAVYSGDLTYASVEATTAYAVNKANQTITFPAIALKGRNSPPFQVNVAASSGLPVNLATTTPTVCSVTSQTPPTVTLAGVTGMCTLSASQSGDGNYNAAPNVSQSFMVEQAVYLVTPVASPNGLIYPATPQSVIENSTAAFTVVPHDGFSASVTSSCGGTLSGSMITTNPIVSNCSVTASFSPVLPAAPGAPSVIFARNTSVLLAPPSIDGGSPILDYKVNCTPQVCNEAFCMGQNPMPLSVTSARPFVVVTGTVRANYSCTARARNMFGSGQESAPFEIVGEGAPTDGVNWLMGVFSRKTHGVRGEFDLAMKYVDSAMRPYETSEIIFQNPIVDPRVAPDGTHKLIFYFSVDVSAPAWAAVETVVGQNMQSIGKSVVSVNGREVEVLLSGIPDNTRIFVTLRGNGFSAQASAAFLKGDVLGVRAVNDGSLAAVKAKSGSLTKLSNFLFDVDASGAIDASDITAVNANKGKVLP